MEKSFHSGMIDTEELQTAYKRNFNLPFPKHPKVDRALRDCFADLTLIDGRVGATVKMLLDGDKTLREWFVVNEDYNSRLEAAKPQDPEALKEWQAMKSYKQELDKLAKMALAYYDQKYGKA